MNKVEKVREIVRKEAGERQWKIHIIPVVKYAKELARKYKVDEEITELAALLHDIGRLKYGPENHEITGSEEAEKILRKLNYSKEIIEEVKDCIRTHRASKNYPPKTKIAEIIRDADALSHFDVFPYLIRLGLKRNDNDMKEAIKWVQAKLNRDWNNKMHLPESKRLAEEKYKATKLILEATEKLLS
jgi:putative nucleotidyltransferase with HDIG domain